MLPTAKSESEEEVMRVQAYGKKYFDFEMDDGYPRRMVHESLPEYIVVNLSIGYIAIEDSGLVER